MGLSDACFEFCEAARKAQTQAARRAAVATLVAEIRHYSGTPYRYGELIDVLDAACIEYASDVLAGIEVSIDRLLFIADSVRENLDRLPSEQRPLNG